MGDLPSFHMKESASSYLLWAKELGFDETSEEKELRFLSKAAMPQASLPQVNRQGAFNSFSFPADALEAI